MLKKIKTFIVELGSLGPLLAFAVLAPGGGILVLSLTHSSWLPLLQTEGFNALLIFISSASLLAGLSLIPTHAVSLVAGLVYGITYGSAIAIFSIVLASILSFIVTGKLVGSKAVDSLVKRPQANEVFKELLKHNFQRTIAIISLVRLSPIMPFAGTNVLLAAAQIKISEFLIASTVGLAPRIILVAIAGAGLSELDFNTKGSKTLLILGIVATLVSLIVIGRLAKKALNKFINASTTTP